MIRPMGYQVLVKPNKVDHRTESGIYLAPKEVDKEQFAQEEGTLMAVGAIAFTEPDWLECPKAGDKVIYKKYAGIVIQHGEEKYRLMPDNEIGAVIEG